MSAPDLIGLAAGALFWLAALLAFVTFRICNAQTRDHLIDDAADFGAVEGGVNHDHCGSSF